MPSCRHVHPSQTEMKRSLCRLQSWVLADVPAQIAPEMHGPCVVHEHGKKVPCVEVLKALCGMLQSASGLQWHVKFRADLENEGFEFDACDQPMCCQQND